MENKLPKGWNTASLESISRMVYGKGLLTKDLTREGYPVYGANGVIGRYPSYLYEEEKVIISCRGAASGVLHKTVPKSFITSNSIVFNLKSSEIDLDYFKYSLLSIDRSKIVTGSAQPQITIENLKELQIPIAPLQEQQRIVAKLDELMEKIDRSRARLERIPKILKRFRQSVLSAAVSGKLTEEWREYNGAMKGWVQKNLREVLTEIKAGKSLKCNEVPPKKGEVGIIKVSALSWGEFLEDESKTITDPKFFNEEYLIKQGDFLFSRANTKELIGAVVIVRDIQRTLMLSDKSLRFLFTREVLPEWILYNLRSEKGRKQIEDFATGNQQSMMNISQGKIREISLSIPDIQEQQAIVEMVETLFSYSDRIETRYLKAKNQLDKLPQSLLAKAFRGELVAQDENDEPATPLLEKIKTKRTLIKGKNSKVKEFCIESVTDFNIAAESNGPYSQIQLINIPANKKAFAKQVLGGKIVSLFKDDQHFTHIKFQKLQYLAEHVAEVDLDWNYYRQSAGPYDPRFMHTVALKLKASKWFEERKYKFYPLEKADKIEGYYDGYFKPVATKLDSLFIALKNSTEDEAEIVATLYAVWNNMIIKKESINDDVIVSTFFEWSDRKKKYSHTQVIKTLAWMKKNRFVPTGFGKLIKERRK